MTMRHEPVVAGHDVDGPQARRAANEQGQTLVTTTLMMIVLLGFVGLVVDGGMFMWERRNLQAAADAGSLAGVRELIDSQALAEAAAEDYVENQNPDGGEAEVTFLTDATGEYITVRAYKQVDGAFLGIFGMADPTLDAKSTARFAQLTGASKGMPMAFVEGGYTPLLNESIKTSNNQNPGNRGIVDLEMKPTCALSSGASDVGKLIATKAGGGVDACKTEPGDKLTVQTGNAGGQLFDGLKSRLTMPDGTMNTDGFLDVFTPDLANPGSYRVKKADSRRIGVIPVIDSWPNGSSNQVTVLDWVVVYIGENTPLAAPNYWPCSPWSSACKEVFVTPVPVADVSDVAAILGDSGWGQYNPDSDSPVSYRLVG